MGSFNRATDVLRFRSPRRRLSQWILWPVFGWRVVAPTPRESRLNLFQRSVLGLARAGVVRIEEVAEHLLISSDLAAVVITEIHALGLTNHLGRPTDVGLRFLKEASDDLPDELLSGHVLQDAFQGHLLPVFHVGDLPLAAVELNDRGWPELVTGSPGDPRRDPAYCLLPDRDDLESPTKPEPADILRLSRAHRRRQQFVPDPEAGDSPRIAQVSFVSTTPNALFLALQVCLHDSCDWIVADPFGPSEAPALRTALERRLDRHPGLRERLLKMLETQDGVPTIGGLQKKAAQAVELRLTLQITTHADLYERLIAMQRAQLEAAQPNAPRDKWDDVVVKSQRVLERTLRLVHELHCNSQTALADVLLVAGANQSPQVLESIAAQLGFRAPLPRGFARVSPSDVAAAEQRRISNLRALVVLSVLAADRVPTHPLRACARRQPELLHQLDDLARLRNLSAHDGDAQDGVPIERALETTYLAVQELLLSA